jgi:pyruvate/2-oxoglutarate dehydrogenase complex dihydrolipoamide acyltransferase (E2) component
MASGDVVRALAPMQATVAKLLVEAGDAVAAGATVVLLESMKMEHPVVAPSSGTVERLLVAAGDTVERGAALLTIEVGAVEAAEAVPAAGPVAGAVRPELAELEVQKGFLADANRTEAVARRHATG